MFCYSLRFIHRPPLHVVIALLYIFQPLPEYFCCIIHIVVSGGPAWQKAPHSSVTMSSKDRGRKPKHPDKLKGEQPVLDTVYKKMTPLVFQSRQPISEARDMAFNHLCVIRPKRDLANSRINLKTVYVKWMG